jgi:hypothetical protein
MSASKITFAYLYPQSYQSLSIGKTTQASSALDVSGDVNIDSGLLYVDGSNNRVGINRTNPSYTLDVNGNLNFTGSLFQNGSTFSGATQWTTSGNNIYYQAGNVGIGKTSPSVALDVSGNINSSSISVNSNQIFGARAWVCFNGTLTSGNIKASQNVSSVTRTTIGTDSYSYTINFTNAMPDTNYAVFGFANSSGPAGSFVAVISLLSKSSTSVTIRFFTENNSLSPLKDDISVCVFR